MEIRRTDEYMHSFDLCDNGKTYITMIDIIITIIAIVM